VFEAVNFPGCPPGHWNAESGGAVAATLFGFTDCSGSSGFRGRGTPGEPYRVALDGRESMEIGGLDLSTRPGYTVAVWFRVNKRSEKRAILVDSWKAAFYTPLRLMIADGKPACSIEAPFPDRIYVASASAPIGFAQWHQAACRFRAASRELALFVDGHLDASSRIPPGSIHSDRVRIGAGPAGGEGFAGDIAEVIFSNQPEQEEAIQTRCQQGSARFAGARCGR